MEDARCAVGVTADAAVADARFEGKGICRNGDGELDVLAVARCSQGFVISHFEV